MYDYKAKTKNVAVLNHYMLAKTLSMFEYENLPDSIPYHELEKLLQVNGFAFITKVNGELYAFSGGVGGEPDVYGNPTTITISNPALKFNKTLDIKKDGVLIKNDDMSMGLIPLYEKHHMLMVENDINIVVNGYNSRMQKLISAPDDKTKHLRKHLLNVQLRVTLQSSVKMVCSMVSKYNQVQPHRLYQLLQ